jgi:hypothetical protein
MTQICYEISIVENEDGWHVVAVIKQGIGANQITVGGIERIITYSTLDRAIKAAHHALDAIGDIPKSEAHK